MASDLQTVKEIVSKISDAGNIKYRKMFGEYGLYCNDIFFATIEDNMFCLKITEAGKKLLKDGKIVSPHKGAYYFFIEDFSNREFLNQLILLTCEDIKNKKK